MDYVNKIILNDTVLIDLTKDTADTPDVVSGKTFHRYDGSPQEGKHEEPVVNLQEKQLTVMVLLNQIMIMVIQVYLK